MLNPEQDYSSPCLTKFWPTGTCFGGISDPPIHINLLICNNRNFIKLHDKNHQTDIESDF